MSVAPVAYVPEVKVSGIYVIHFGKPYQHARHYTGWTDDLAQRLQDHVAGRGARLMQVVTGAGIEWTLGRFVEGADRHRERRMKVSGGASRFCAICMRSEALMPPQHLQDLARQVQGIA